MYYFSLQYSTRQRKIISHNRTTEGYPLKISAQEVVVEDSPVDTELVTKLLPKLNYPAVLTAVKDVSEKVESVPELPGELPPEGEELEAPTLEALHHVLFNIHIIEGELVCPDTGRKFPVKQGIPNMILHEDEI